MQEWTLLQMAVQAAFRGFGSDMLGARGLVTLLETLLENSAGPMIAAHMALFCHEIQNTLSIIVNKLKSVSGVFKAFYEGVTGDVKGLPSDWGQPGGE